MLDKCINLLFSEKPAADRKVSKLLLDILRNLPKHILLKYCRSKVCVLALVQLEDNIEVILYFYRVSQKDIVFRKIAKPLIKRPFRGVKGKNGWFTQV